MITVKHTIVLVSISAFFPGCVTVEGPDHKYVLAKEGVKEVDKNTGATQHSGARSESSSQTSANAVRQRGSNYDEAFGACFRHGLHKDPDPWTSFEWVVDKDIDVVYPRIMREFGYIRWEAPLAYGSGLPVCEIHMRYEEVPGSHYQMRNFIKHAHGSEELENTIEVDLAKEGKNKVRIRVSYYSGNTLDPRGYEASLRNRVEQALR